MRVCSAGQTETVEKTTIIINAEIFVFWQLLVAFYFHIQGFFLSAGMSKGKIYSSKSLGNFNETESKYASCYFGR